MDKQDFYKKMDDYSSLIQLKLNEKQKEQFFNFRK